MPAFSTLNLKGLNPTAKEQNIGEAKNNQSPEVTLNHSSNSANAQGGIQQSGVNVRNDIDSSGYCKIM